MTPKNGFTAKTSSTDSPRPCRGVIIVDTGSLMGLGGAVQTGDDGKKESPAHYFNILTFLGKCGYRIIIPEIVAFETAQTLHGGSYLGKYFTETHSHKHYDSPAVRKFLTSVSRNEKEFVEMPILTTQGPPAIANLMREAHKIYDDLDMNDSSKRYAIQQLQSMKPRNAGDSVIEHILSTIPKTPPVFVLTEDWKFVEDRLSTSEHKFNLLTLHGLLGSLRNSGLLAALPEVPQRKNTEKFFQKCREAARKVNPEHEPNFRTVDCAVDQLSMRDPAPIAMQNKPLYLSFKALAASMSLPEVPDSNVEWLGHTNPTDSSHVQKAKRPNTPYTGVG
jgi:hypothetical protein